MIYCVHFPLLQYAILLGNVLLGYVLLGHVLLGQVLLVHVTATIHLCIGLLCASSAIAVHATGAIHVRLACSARLGVTCSITFTLESDLIRTSMDHATKNLVSLHIVLYSQLIRSPEIRILQKIFRKHKD